MISVLETRLKYILFAVQFCNHCQKDLHFSYLKFSGVYFVLFVTLSIERVLLPSFPMPIIW